MARRGRLKPELRLIKAEPTHQEVLMGEMTRLELSLKILFWKAMSFGDMRTKKEMGLA